MNCTTSENKVGSMNNADSISLFYKDGTSDKVYNVALEIAGGDTGVVNFSYGRRGSALTAGTKTQTPVSLVDARQIYDKLVFRQLSKGYTPSGSGVLFSGSENAGRVSGLVPQLLNLIEEEELNFYISSDSWCIQEKYDGKRIMARIKDSKVECSNRKGLIVSIPLEIEQALSALPDCVLDGELLGSSYVLFDILEDGFTHLRDTPYEIRHESLRSALLPFCGQIIRLTDNAFGEAGKTALFNRVKNARGEGVVFKDLDAKSVPGKPASGGSQIKYKFTKTCTCIVSKQNSKRSVGLALLDSGGKCHNVGNVTIPPNKEIPSVFSLVEVRYLYAFLGGSLYQPFYLGVRDDIDSRSGAMSQLVYKPESGDNLESDDDE